MTTICVEEPESNRVFLLDVDKIGNTPPGWFVSITDGTFILIYLLNEQWAIRPDVISFDLVQAIGKMLKPPIPLVGS